jgi:hypothetical protein
LSRVSLGFLDEYFFHCPSGVPIEEFLHPADLGPAGTVRPSLDALLLARLGPALFCGSSLTGLGYRVGRLVVVSSSDVVILWQSAVFPRKFDPGWQRTSTRIFVVPTC